MGKTSLIYYELLFFRRLISVIHNPVINDTGLNKNISILQPRHIFSVTGKLTIHQEHSCEEMTEEILTIQISFLQGNNKTDRYMG